MKKLALTKRTLATLNKPALKQVGGAGGSHQVRCINGGGRI